MIPFLFAFLAMMPCCNLSVSVKASKGEPIAAATVHAGDVEIQTDEKGVALVPFSAAGTFSVEVSAPGFQTVRKEADVPSGSTTDLEILLPEASTQSVTVEGKINSEGSSSTLAPVTAETLKRLPTDPPTLADALPLIPGIYRTPEGRLRVSGGPEYRSTLLVNSLDVTDPATGRFGATVPTDSVQSLNVFKSPFLAEYGRFTAAVVVVDTKKGGDKWHFELNDPTPELRLRSRHLVGVRAFTPRLNFSGPLIKNKLFISQSGEYRLNKTPIFSLGFPNNETLRESWNSLTQFDYISSANHTLTATIHIVPQKLKFADLSFYRPRPVTPNFRGHELNAGVTDHLVIGSGLLETAVSAIEVTGRTYPQAFGEMTLLPNVGAGTYFAEQDRRARRLQWLESYTITEGAHTWKFGTSAVRSTLNGWYRARPVNIASLTGQVLSRIDYVNRPSYSLNDWESGAYAQDHWQIRPNFSVDAGLRLDWQNITGTARIGPRLGTAWAPFGNGKTVVRGGIGWFYDRVPLVAYTFENYPWQIVDGTLLVNRFGQRSGGGSLIFGADRPGNYAPRSRAWSAQIEHRFGAPVRMRANYLENNSEGLLVLQPSASTVTLAANGQARYRQLELISQFSFKEGQEIFLSYTRSAGRGNLNEFGDWLGDFPVPVIRPDAVTTIQGNMPHRLLLWGVIPFDANTRIAPVVEYRTGLPFSALDQFQQYYGLPNDYRYPNFLSVDFRVARDVHVRNHAIQLSFSMFNITNHWNPDTVRLNANDPQFGEFLGQHRRRYRIDLDFLF